MPEGLQQIVDPEAQISKNIGAVGGRSLHLQFQNNLISRETLHVQEGNAGNNKNQTFVALLLSAYTLLASHMTVNDLVNAIRVSGAACRSQQVHRHQLVGRVARWCWFQLASSFLIHGGQLPYMWVKTVENSRPEAENNIAPSFPSPPLEIRGILFSENPVSGPSTLLSLAEKIHPSGIRPKSWGGAKILSEARWERQAVVTGSSRW